MKPRILREPPLLRTLAAAGAVGLALSASTALAQTSQGDSGGAAAAAPSASNGAGGGSAASPSNPADVSGVVVQAPPQPDHPQIPPDKAKAFAAEAAKDEAWRRYRQSTPSLDGGTLGMSRNYPGLQSLLPSPDESPEGH